MALFPSFAPGPTMGGPVFDPGIPTPVFTGPIDLGGVLGDLFGSGFGPPSIPIPGFGPGLGFGPPQLPAPVTTMPAPISMTGHCLLRRRRRINWCNPRALSRANRRLHAFNKHARKYIKITRKVKTPRRRRK